LRQEAGLRGRAGINLFIFVSVLFVVKSDSKRMTAIEILFTTETALFVPWEWQAGLLNQVID
jgi:hypothetical protein